MYLSNKCIKHVFSSETKGSAYQELEFQSSTETSASPPTYKNASNRPTRSGLYGVPWLIWDVRSFSSNKPVTEACSSRSALPTSDCDSERGTWSIALMEHYSCLAILCNAAAALPVADVGCERAYSRTQVQSHSPALNKVHLLHTMHGCMCFHLWIYLHATMPVHMRTICVCKDT